MNAEHEQQIAELKTEIEEHGKKIKMLEDSIRDAAAIILQSMVLVIAVKKHLPTIKEMAGQVIDPKDNVFSRIVEDFESAIGPLK